MFLDNMFLHAKLHKNIYRQLVKIADRLTNQPACYVMERLFEYYFVSFFSSFFNKVSENSSSVVL